MEAEQHWNGFQLVGFAGDDANDLTQYSVFRQGREFAYIRLRRGRGGVYIPPRSMNPSIEATGITTVDGFMADALKFVAEQWKKSKRSN